jgi:hypothetical protein
MEDFPVRGMYASAAELRLEDAIARAEFAQLCANKDAAVQYEAILATLHEAREHPELFLGDAVHHVATDRAEFAERAAIADLAVRLRLSETTIRMQAMRAADLRGRTPTIWAHFRAGDISVGNATVTAELAATLPIEVCAAFEAALIEAARSLPTPRFRDRARRVREKLDPHPLAERHALAREQRRVWFEADRDGMCWLTARACQVVCVSGHRRVVRGRG